MRSRRLPRPAGNAIGCRRKCVTPCWPRSLTRLPSTLTASGGPCAESSRGFTRPVGGTFESSTRSSSTSASCSSTGPHTGRTFIDRAEAPSARARANEPTICGRNEVPIEVPI
jgi:hypothetical protein